MLARIWSPILRGARRHRVALGVAAGAASATLAVIAALGLQPPSTRLPACAALGAAIAIALVAARPGPAIAAILATLAGASVSALSSGGDAATAALTAALAAAVAAPLLDGLRRARDGEALHAAAVRGAGFVVVAAQPAAIALLALRPGALGGFAVSVALLAVWPQAWRRAVGAATWSPLPAESLRRPVADQVMGAVAAFGGLTALAIVGWRVADGLAWVLGVVAACTSLWAMLTARPSLTIAALVGQVAAIGWMGVGAAALPGRDVAAALALAQVPALTLTLAVASHRGWTAYLAVAQMALAGLACDPALRVPLVAAMAAQCLVCGAVALPRRRAPRGATAIDRARAALSALEPYWRFYGGAKLRLDPVYGQLAADATRWGRVLDLGCGPGLTAALALARGDVDAYLGVDLDRDKLLAARRVLAAADRPLDAQWSLVEGTLPAAAPLPGPVDTVLALDVLHYWPAAQQAAVLAQARAALAADGVLWLREGVATAGDAGRVAAGERFTTRWGFNPPTDLHFLARDAVESLLRDAGLRIEACVPSGAENLLWRCRPATGL